MILILIYNGVSKKELTMTFLLSTALIVIGMGWFAFGPDTGKLSLRSPAWTRCLASALIVLGVLTLSLQQPTPWP